MPAGWIGQLIIDRTERAQPLVREMFARKGGDRRMPKAKKAAKGKTTKRK